MARKQSQPVYKRVFFDRTLLVGVIALAVAYVVQGTWLGAFSEAAAFAIGSVWAYRAITTNKSVAMRLMATLMLVLIVSLLAFYLGRVNGLL